MRSALVALGAVAAASCADAPELSPVPVAELPWPEPAAPLPACEPLFPELAAPALPAPAGDIALELGALAPVDAAVAIEVRVLDADSGDVDDSAAGALALDLGGAGEVVDLGEVVDGRARAVVRFAGAGERVITAALGDGREGSAATFVYDSKLPLWELEVADADFETLLVDPHERLWVPATVSIDGERHPGKLRLHGGSSRDYPKKSLRFNVADGLTRDGQRKLILRAEWRDPTMLRNWLAHRLFADETWLAAPHAELVHLRKNGVFYGLMLHTERIDPDFLLARGLSVAASLYEADPPRGFVGDLTPLPAEADYELVYPQRTGPPGHAELIALVELLDQRAPELEADVAIDDVLTYLALLAIVQSQDHVNKNYYLYRDPEGADRWQVIPWDLDLTFGHLFDPDEGLLSDEILVDGHPYVGVAAAGTGLQNRLIDRLLDHPERSARYLELIDHLLARIPDERVDALLDHAVCLAGPEMIADPKRRANLAELPQRIDEVREFWAGRRDYLAAWIRGEPPAL